MKPLTKPFRETAFVQIIPHFTWSCHGRVATGSYCYPCLKSGGRGRSATPSWTNDAEVPPRRRKSPRNRSPTFSVYPSVWSSSSLPPRPSRIGCGSWSSDEVFVFYSPPRWMANPARPDSTVSCLPRSLQLISGWSIEPPRFAWTPWAILAAHFRVSERWLKTRRMERRVEKYDDISRSTWEISLSIYIYICLEDVERSSSRGNGRSFDRLYCIYIEQRYSLIIENVLFILFILSKSYVTKMLYLIWKIRENFNFRF